MGMAALAEPQAIKISSKRQVTIPAKWYRELEFGEYALCTWTDQGILLQPIEADDEDVTVDILRYLVKQGFEGEELVEQYRDMSRKIIPLKERLDAAERDIAEGRTGSFSELQARMREKHGLRN